MTTLYLYDECGNYTDSVVHTPFAPLPEGSTLLPPPEGEYPVWNGTEWELRDAPAVPPDPIPVVPQVITPRQCRLELLNRGLLEQVETMITAQDQATQITWEYAVLFERRNPLLLALAGNLGLTSEQLDEFFIAAAAL